MPALSELQTHCDPPAGREGHEEPLEQPEGQEH